MRRIVIVGQKARATPEFLLVDIPSTSGRIDVLLHAVRAALLVSHGVRRDTIVYLALLGLPEQPRLVRIEGSASRYLRPDERSLGTTLKKVLAHPVSGPVFSEARPGMCVADGGVTQLWAELAGSAIYLLEPGAPDLRSQELPAGDVSFVLGDHIGLTEAVRAELLALGAQPVSIGPRALHSGDVIAIVHNELDRREALLG